MLCMNAMVVAQTDDAERTQCRLSEVAQLPIWEFNGRFITTLEINRRTMPFLIDTGSGGTLISPEAADQVGVAFDRQRKVVIDGFGRFSGEGHPGIARRIKLGSVIWQDYAVTVTDLEGASVPRAPVGVLGADLLAQFDIEFDFPGRTMTLYRPSGCRTDWVPWLGVYQVWRPMRTAQNALIFPVSLNEQPLFAELDTGAQMTIVSRQAALSAGVDPKALDETPVEAATAVGGGAPMTVRPYLLSTFRVGALTMHHRSLYVGDAVLANADVLLGMDVLRNTRLWLSYSSNRIFMRYTAGPAAALQNFLSRPVRE
ncbi:Retroviral aspartyl protease [Caballeronia calidae]|uniref:Retroviral aspartyl protease n=2 Tax=Caballeronia calidae TaxID=1777139 RepID=A0A158EJS1_9BURK|nr:Retroviral aspartyl protease [Caballeronia calidae]